VLTKFSDFTVDGGYLRKIETILLYLKGVLGKIKQQ